MTPAATARTPARPIRRRAHHPLQHWPRPPSCCFCAAQPASVQGASVALEAISRRDFTPQFHATRRWQQLAAARPPLPRLRAAAGILAAGAIGAVSRRACMTARAAGYAALNDTSIKAAVRACKAESGGADNKKATFKCPETFKVFGPMQGWDTSKVTSFKECAQ